MLSISNMVIILHLAVTLLMTRSALLMDSDNSITPHMGLYFMLNNIVYDQGDTVLIGDIGIQPVNRNVTGSTLVCVTTNVNADCCRGKDNMNNSPYGGKVGEWYYPNGTLVLRPEVNAPVNSAFNRIGHLHQVRLARINAAFPAPLGVYRCEVPDGNDGTIVSADITLSEGSSDGSGLPLTSDNMLMPTTSDSDTQSTQLQTTIETTSSAASDEIIPSTDIFTGDKILTQAVIGATIGGIIVFVVLILVITTLTCLMKTSFIGRRTAKRKILIDHSSMAITTQKYNTHGDKIVDSTSFSKEVLGNLNKNIVPVAVEEFSAHVVHMQADRDNLFEQEYDTLEPIAEFDCGISQLPANLERNRFANIYPYNFNRALLNTLHGVTNSDYINASYINGYGRNKVYIAAQGPKEETLEDFWRMVWEHSIPTIVMLTRVFEGKKKCEMYWPENIGEVFVPCSESNFTVKLDSLLPFAEFVVRKMTLCKDETGFEVTMFHYLAWPDHGVPANAMSMINFIKRARKTHPYSKEDLVLVHCSAGVGRTGTFITIDYMLERIKTEKNINIYEFVDGLRKQRVWMVQTMTQYIFIHNALDEFCTCGDTEIQSADLRIVINRLGRNVKSEPISGFKQQYQILDTVTKQVSHTDISDAMSNSNVLQNRYGDKLPFNHTRVHLRPFGSQCSDYINASFVEGYRRTCSYIATQGPLPHTVGSFWRMVWEQQVKCIVMLCKVEENNEVICHCYWPQSKGSSENYDNITVTLLAHEIFADYAIRKLQISKFGSEKSSIEPGFTVTQFQYLKWPESSVPQVTSSILEIANLVQKVQISRGNKAIVVMCNNGVGRSGTFIAIHAQMERIKAEGVVDFFQFIKSIHFQRAGLVSDELQYEFCHRVLADFLDGFDAYANFKELI